LRVQEGLLDQGKKRNLWVRKETGTPKGVAKMVNFGGGQDVAREGVVAQKQGKKKVGVENMFYRVHEGKKDGA